MKKASNKDGQSGSHEGDADREEQKEGGLTEYSSLIKAYFRLKDSSRLLQADMEKIRGHVGLLENALIWQDDPAVLVGRNREFLLASNAAERLLGGRESAQEAVEKLSWKISEAESLGRRIFFGSSQENGASERAGQRGSITPLGSGTNIMGFLVRFGPESLEKKNAGAGAAPDDRRLMDAINSLQAAFIMDAPPGELFRNMLDHLLDLTQSRFGFVGRILRAPNGRPYLKTHAITDISWNDLTRNLFRKISTEGMEFRNLGTLFGHTLRTGEEVISNNPSADERSGGLPAGHPKLDSYAGVPFVLGGKMVGMAGLANRPGGYSAEALEKFKPLFATCASLIDAYESKEQRRLAEEGVIATKMLAEKATREKDKYISLIAHDLKSPFTSIIAFLKLLGKGKVSLLDPDNRPLFDSIIESSERAARMIDEVLSLARLGMGAIKLTPRFIDARSAAVGAISLMGHMARTKEIVIDNDIPSGTRIRVDPALFSEVLANLLSNAIKFSHRGGKVAFFIPPSQPTTVAVRDSGVGMDEKTIPLIFRHDYKTSFEGTEGEKGSGLALPLCKEIMRAHQGDLIVESALGRGSVFYARLPKKQPLVMVVDDERVAREGIRKILEQIDVEVIEASGASEAVSRVTSRQPDLICLDLKMPGEDGFKVIEILKGSQDSMATPILVITSDTTPASRELAVRLGADDFITKESVGGELISRVRKFVV